MQKPQAVIDRDLTDAGGHTGKSRSEVSSNTREECAGLLHTFLLRRNGDVFFLNEIVALLRLAQNKRVILVAVEVTAVALHGHEQRPTEVLLIELTVKERDLRRGSDGQRVQERAVGHKEFPLFFRGGHGVIDIKKAPSF